jgi:hypothetical protein
LLPVINSSNLNYTKISIWLLSLFLSHTGVSQANCELRKDDDDIKVYLCDSEISNFKTIVVDLEVPATLSQYAALVMDIESYHEWQYKATGARLVGQVSKTEIYYYLAIDTPWPTDDRDMIWHLTMNQDPATKVIVVDLVEIPDYIPRIEGVVRIPKAKSTLTISPIDKTHVHVHYIIDVDPGGTAPAWIVNMFAAQTPWNTYNNLRERIKSQGENRISVPYIEDY